MTLRPVSMTRMAKYSAATNSRENTRLNKKPRAPWKRWPPCKSPMVSCRERTAAEAEVSRTTMLAAIMAVLLLAET